MQTSVLRKLASALRTQFSRPRPNEAPRVRSAVPYLGSALAYGQNAAEFLGAQRRQHGDVFTVFMAGTRMTFLCDPQEVPTVLLDKRLDFHELANEISSKAFGHSLESLELLDEPAVIRSSIDNMRGDALVEMTERMAEKLEDVLLHSEPPQTDGLYEFIGKVIFSASTDAIFGDGFSTQRVFDEFNVLDRRFPLLVAGVAARYLPGVQAAREALHRRQATAFANASALVHARGELFHPVAEHERRGYETALLWAAVANTIPATFWALFYIARDPTVRARIVEEIRQVSADADTGPSGTPRLDRAALSQMVLLDSAIDEAFRITSGSLVIRVAREAMTLTLKDGRELALRAGDQVALYPYLTHHDAELFENPAEYRFDRFVENGKPKRNFERRGERVRHYLMPFGGGVSMCPGRHFARNEIKLTVAFLLSAFDLELTDTAVPALDQTRAGLGILPPAADVGFTLRRHTGA